jgi:hypothetical protein
MTTPGNVVLEIDEGAAVVGGDVVVVLGSVVELSESDRTDPAVHDASNSVVKSK